jgi:glycosyltransferase involved in cell wall biosynthesis
MRNKKVGIITVPISISGITPLSHLIEIVCSISDKTILITGNDGYEYFKSDERLDLIGISHKDYTTYIQRVFHYLALQITIAYWILKKRRDFDILIFFFGGDTLALPMLITYLLRKKGFLLVPGSSIKTLETQRDPLNMGLKVLHFISCLLAKKIILYSNCLIEEYDLKRWKNKILIAHRHFIDFNTFRITIPFSERSSRIGYIGRLGMEKGVQNFVQAIPIIIRNRGDISVFIGGEGQLKESIIASLQMEKITTHVDLPGWISHDDLNKYLNQLQLLVVPSYTEGLPNIMLEAMACGTPVLATSVGAIPDVIREGETGFIMENNSPECIAENVIRALDYPDLEKVAENGRQFVEENFTFEKTVKRWKEILEY